MEIGGIGGNGNADDADDADLQDWVFGCVCGAWASVPPCFGTEVPKMMHASAAFDARRCILISSLSQYAERDGERGLGWGTGNADDADWTDWNGWGFKDWSSGGAAGGVYL